MIYRNTKNGREESAVPGSTLASILEDDPDWARVDGPTGTDTQPMPSLDRLTRAELDDLAEEAGVPNPKGLNSKAAVVKAIRDHQGE